MPAKANQTNATVKANDVNLLFIALILASGLFITGRLARAADPPPDLLKKIATTMAADAKARDNYTYRQSVIVQEFDIHDMVSGEYQETRDVTFGADGSRFEQQVSKPINTLKLIKLTPEDFADIRNIQPFFLTSDNVSLYSGKFQGEETLYNNPCFVVYVQPKQILAGQRYFEGTLWVRQSDFGVFKSEGQGVPQIETMKTQNLFPHFHTQWEEVDGKWMFPKWTVADDTLFFRDWPQRIRVVIRYSNYKRFGAESTLTFQGEAPDDKNAPPAPTTPEPPK